MPSMKNIGPYLLVMSIFTSMSCASVSEPFKVVWGSSTRALEDARIDAVSKIYECEFDDCFNAVLELARKKLVMYRSAETYDSTVSSGAEEKPAASLTEEEKQGFDVFIKDRIKAVIVVMGIYGNTNTTEAGIFFSRYNRSSFKIEISSLSTTAKTKVAEMVFAKLDQQFKEVK